MPRLKRPPLQELEDIFQLVDKLDKYAVGQRVDLLTLSQIVLGHSRVFTSNDQ
jgi:hypothetical protein